MKAFEIIEIEQGSTEWHDLRKLKIGASCAPIILGISPWCSPYRLWGEMMETLRPKEQTDHMRRGVELEPIARAQFNNELGLDMKPAVLVSIEHPWMMASLDGISYDPEFILEIKCPGAKTIALAQEGIIPDMYLAQIQHQFAVSGYTDGYYYVYDGNHGIAIFVKRIEPMIDKIIEKEYEFYKALIRMEPLEEWIS